MIITGENLTKSELLKDVKPGYSSSKKIARNTVKIVYPDNTVIIRYWRTNVITINPDTSVILNSGGYYTKMTKARIEENTNLSITQKNGIWHIWTNRNIPGNRQNSLFYDGITISADGKILSGVRVSSDKCITEFKRDLKKLVNKITPDNIPLPSSGDCLVCRFDLASRKATAEHLLRHVKEGYMHGSLIVLCLTLSGHNPAIIYSMRLIDVMKRDVRRVINETCLPIISNNPEIYPNIEVL